MIAAGTRARARGQLVRALPALAVPIAALAPVAHSPRGVSGALIALKGETVETVVLALPLAVAPIATTALSVLASAPVWSVVSSRLALELETLHSPTGPDPIGPALKVRAEAEAAPNAVPVVLKARGVPPVGLPSRTVASSVDRSAATAAIRRRRAGR